MSGDFEWQDGATVFADHRAYQAWQRAWSRVSDLVATLVCFSVLLVGAAEYYGLSRLWIWAYVLEVLLAVMFERVLHRYQTHTMEAYIDQLRRENASFEKTVDRESGEFAPYRSLDAS